MLLTYLLFESACLTVQFNFSSGVGHFLYSKQWGHWGLLFLSPSFFKISTTVQKLWQWCISIVFCYILVLIELIIINIHLTFVYIRWEDNMICTEELLFFYCTFMKPCDQVNRIPANQEYFHFHIYIQWTSSFQFQQKLALLLGLQLLEA